MTFQPSAPLDVADLAERVNLGFPAALADLGALVRIPGVAWPSFDQEQLVRSADAVAELFRGTGVFDSVEISRAKVPGTEEYGQPGIIAVRRAKNNRPTVLLYAHHDVQPPGDEALWNTPPFEPTVIDGRLYGRGAADDKAGIMAHVSALRVLADALGDDFDLGLAVFIEGEEEYGSRSFTQFLDDHADVLGADVIIVADSGNFDSETPGLTVSLRGNARFTVTVRTLEHASHSGMFGGAVPDAMTAMVRLLATLWDETGAPAVAGLESREASVPPYSEATLRDEAGLLDGVSPAGTGEILNRIWNQPSITVIGMDATSSENASNTLPPSMTAVISARVAPGQSAQAAFDALKAHIEAHTPFGAEVTISDVDLGEAFLADDAAPATNLARQALTDAYGKDCMDLGIGGSIPFIADFVERYPQAQILVTGVEDPYSRAHSPNESLHLETFRNATTAEALLLARLNTMTRDELLTA